MSFPGLPSLCLALPFPPSFPKRCQLGSLGLLLSFFLRISPGFFSSPLFSRPAVAAAPIVYQRIFVILSFLSFFFFRDSESTLLPLIILPLTFFPYLLLPLLRDLPLPFILPFTGSNVYIEFDILRCHPQLYSFLSFVKRLLRSPLTFSCVLAILRGAPHDPFLTHQLIPVILLHRPPFSWLPFASF